jgi:hypothetical protein
MIRPVVVLALLATMTPHPATAADPPGDTPASVVNRPATEAAQCLPCQVPITTMVPGSAIIGLQQRGHGRPDGRRVGLGALSDSAATQATPSGAASPAAR